MMKMSAVRFGSLCKGRMLSEKPLPFLYLLSFLKEAYGHSVSFLVVCGYYSLICD